MYRKNAWKKYTNEKLDALMAFNEDYKDFLSKGKTERKCVELSLDIAHKHGYKDIKEFSALKAGDKVYLSLVKNLSKMVLEF